MILHNLLRRATRSLLTILGIAVGVATVVALGAMANGITKNYGSVLGLSNDLLATQANAYDVVFSSLDEPWANASPRFPTWPTWTRASLPGSPLRKCPIS